MEKYMKRYFVLGLIIWSSFDIGAMEAEYNRISVPDCQMELDGDSVRLTMTIDIENVKVSTNHSVEYTPVLISYEHGEDSVAKLPKILLKGRMEYKAYQRYVSSKEYRKVALKEQKEQYFLVTPVLHFASIPEQVKRLNIVLFFVFPGHNLSIRENKFR